MTPPGDENGTPLRPEPASGRPRRTLTPRELEVLRLASVGNSGPRIAELLAVSPTTVKSYFEKIYLKLGVGDRASAVAVGLRDGYIE